MSHPYREPASAEPARRRPPGRHALDLAAVLLGGAGGYASSPAVSNSGGGSGTPRVDYAAERLFPLAEQIERDFEARYNTRLDPGERRDEAVRRLRAVLVEVVREMTRLAGVELLREPRAEALTSAALAVLEETK